MGKLFHNVGPATEKALSPALLVVLGIAMQIQTVTGAGGRRAKAARSAHQTITLVLGKNPAQTLVHTEKFKLDAIFNP